MAQIWEYIKIALMNIKSNKGRSVLTMLGIIIGISSVIMVISIGTGVRTQVNSELEGLGGGLLVFYVDSTRKNTTGRIPRIRFSPRLTSRRFLMTWISSSSSGSTVESPSVSVSLST